MGFASRTTTVFTVGSGSAAVVVGAGAASVVTAARWAAPAARVRAAPADGHAVRSGRNRPPPPATPAAPGAGQPGSLPRCSARSAVTQVNHVRQRLLLVVPRPHVEPE